MGISLRIVIPGRTNERDEMLLVLGSDLPLQELNYGTFIRYEERIGHSL